MWKQAWAAAGTLAVSAGVSADETAKPDPNDHPDSTWAARVQAGYSRTGGTTDTSAGNALLHVAHVMGDWKVLLGFDGVYGSTKGETTAQAWHARVQGDYNFTERFYWYLAYRYDDDRFSGFAYQQVASTGLGYQAIKTDATKLSIQAGVGQRALRPELLTLDEIGGIVSSTELARETDTVLDGAVNFEHAFNAATKFTASAAVEEGDLNTMTSYNLALQVKMTSQLALSAGYSVVRNSKPPPGAVPNATLTTVNLVYEFKNSKLPSE